MVGSPLSPELKRARNGDFVDIEMRGVSWDATKFRRGPKIIEDEMVRADRPGASACPYSDGVC